MYQIIVLSILVWGILFLQFFGFSHDCYIHQSMKIESAWNMLYSVITISTIIIALAIDRVCIAIIKVRKAIEDKQPVIIQKRVSASEQDKK